MGPHVRTTQRKRAAIEYPPGLGISKKHLEPVIRVVEAWGLQYCPFIIAEDATAQQMRADVMSIDKHVYVFGLSGTTLVVQTLEEFKKAMDAGTLKYASNLYVHTLVPLVKGAPYLPLFAFSHDNSNDTFTSGLIKTIWQWIMEVGTTTTLSQHRITNTCCASRPVPT